LVGYEVNSLIGQHLRIYFFYLRMNKFISFLYIFYVKLCIIILSRFNKITQKKKLKGNALSL
jgi:hypothetical protein